LDIYTENLWDVGKITLDFKKGNVDILTIHKFVSAMILGDDAEALQYIQSAGASPTVSTGFGGFMQWLGNSIEQEAKAMDEMFHSNPPLLMQSEHCEKVYKTGRDLFIYTTHRVILVDVQGLTGKKVEYLVRASKSSVASSLPSVQSLIVIFSCVPHCCVLRQSY
jgi:hypothetical protein